MTIRTVYSDFRKRQISFVDDCGCTGGIHEEEYTQHGFHGASWVVGYAICCSECGKVLTELPKVQVSDTTEAK